MTRWAEVRAGRDARPERPPISDEQNALIRLTTLPEWRVFLAYMAATVDDQPIDASNPNFGALSRLEGRRSLQREIEQLATKVSDERSTRQSGSGPG